MPNQTPTIEDIKPDLTLESLKTELLPKNKSILVNKISTFK
jgi:hypothetical protein